jgi:Zn-dependent protease with chaperone function
MQKKIKIFESALIDSPISYGCFLWQPTIVISSKESKNNVSDRSLTTYLAHHIYHLKSNDFLITPLFFCLIGLTTMIALNILLPSLAISLPFSTLLAAEIGGGIAGMSATGLLRIWQENRAWNNADLLINS